MDKSVLPIVCIRPKAVLPLLKKYPELSKGTFSVDKEAFVILIVT